MTTSQLLSWSDAAEFPRGNDAFMVAMQNIISYWRGGNKKINENFCGFPFFLFYRKPIPTSSHAGNEFSQLREKSSSICFFFLMETVLHEKEKNKENNLFSAQKVVMP